MTDHLFALPPDFDGRVRLFPLADLVVFPRNVQPLRIFEPRYCEMLEEALQGDRLITMATLVPAKAAAGSPPAIAAAVCVGQIAVHEAQPDGTHHIALIGLRRGRIEKELVTSTSFRKARVRVLEDRDPGPKSPAAQQIGNELARRLEQTTRGTERLVEEYVGGNLSLGALTDIVSFHLPCDVSFKLELLAQADVIERAQQLLRKLPAPGIHPKMPGVYPPKFSEN